MSTIKIEIQSTYSSLVDASTLKIIKIAEKNNAKILGPFLLPVKNKIFKTIRHIKNTPKKPKEKLNKKKNKRLIIISDININLMNQIKKLSLPSGIKIKVISINN